MSLNLFKLFIVFAVGSAWGFDKGESYKQGITVYSFSLTGRYDRVHMTHYHMEGNPSDETFRLRYRDSESHGRIYVNEEGTFPVNIFKELQRASLEEMLRNGYINQELFEGLMEAKDHYDAREVYYIVHWAEMEYHELDAVFDHDIEWSRVLKTKTDGSLFRVMRSSLMLGLGQRYTNQSGLLDARPMAWQQYKTGEGEQKAVPIEFREIRNLDRNAFTHALEVSRLYNARKKVMQGNTTIVARVAAWLALADAEVHNIPLHRYGVFALAIQPERALIFHRFFKMSHFNETEAERISRDPEKALKNFRQRPFTNPPQHSVMYAPLDRFSDLLKPNDIFGKDYEIQHLFGPRTLTPFQARALRDDVFDFRFQYWFYPDAPEQDVPVVVMNGSELAQGSLVFQPTKYGIPKTDVAAFYRFQAIAAGNDGNQRFDAFTHFFGEDSWVFADDAIADDIQRTIRIDNLREAAFLAHPKDFLANVLMGIYTHIGQVTQKADPVGIGNAVQEMNLRRGTQFPANGVGVFNDVFSHLRFTIATTSRHIAQDAARMGAKMMRCRVESVPRFKVIMAPDRASFTLEIEKDLEGYLMMLTGADVLREMRRVYQFMYQQPLVCARGITKELKRQARMQF